MIVYMLRSLDTGRYYEETTDQWLEQEKASVWALKFGVAMTRLKIRGPNEIVAFTLEEIK